MSANLMTMVWLLWLLLVYPQIQKLIAKPMFAEPEGVVLGDRQLLLNDTGITETGQKAKYFYAWKAVESVAFEKNIAVIWMEPGVGLWLPRSAFSTSEDEQDFKAFVIERTGPNAVIT